MSWPRRAARHRPARTRRRALALLAAACLAGLAWHCVTAPRARAHGAQRRASATSTAANASAATLDALADGAACVAWRRTGQCSPFGRAPPAWGKQNQTTGLRPDVQPSMLAKLILLDKCMGPSSGAHNTVLSAAELRGTCTGEGRRHQVLVAKQDARACGGPAVLSLDHSWPGILRVRRGAHGPAVCSASRSRHLSLWHAQSVQLPICTGRIAWKWLSTPCIPRLTKQPGPMQKGLHHTGWAAAGMQHSRASAAARGWPRSPGARCRCRRM